MSSNTTYARRTGELSRLELRDNNGHDGPIVDVLSVEYYNERVHALTLDDAEAFAKDILARVKRARREQKKRAQT